MTSPVLLDEAIDDGRRMLAPVEVVPYGLEDILVGCQEHVMEAYLEPTTLRPRRQHGATIIGDNEPDLLTEPLCEGLAPIGRARVSPIEIARSVEIVCPAEIILTRLWDRAGIAGKLERELEHAIWS